MNLWKKIKQSIKKSTDKAADLVEGGMEKLKESQVDVMELGKFQSAVEELRQTVNQKYADLGIRVFNLFTAGKQNTISDEINTNVEQLKNLKKELDAKDKDLTNAFKNYEDQSISMNKLKAFKEELEASGSAVEYLIVDENAPYIGLTLSEIDFPDDLLLGLIIHQGSAIIPSGDTQINVGDKIMLLGKKESVIEALFKFGPKTEELQSSNND